MNQTLIVIVKLIQLGYFINNYIKCYRKYYLSLPLLLLVGVVFPSVLFVLLSYIRKTKKTEDTNIKYQFGFIYYAFKEKFIYWEVIIIVRKILLQLIIVLFANQIKFNEKYPSIIQCFIVVIATLLQIYCQPYNKSKFNQLNNFESICLLAQLLCNFLFVFQLYTANLIPSFINTINVWLFLIINAMMIALFFKLFFIFSIKPSIAKMLVKVKDYTSRFFNKYSNYSENSSIDLLRTSVFTPQTQTMRNKLPEQSQDIYELPEIDKLKNEIESLKSIINLKNQEIYYLKSKLNVDVKEFVHSKNSYLCMKDLSSENLELNAMDSTTIDLDQNQLQKIQKIGILQSEKTLYENQNVIIKQKNFLEGEFSSLTKSHCACQLITVISKNVKLLIEEIDFDFNQNELESKGILLQLKKTVIDSEIDNEPRRFEFQIFYSLVNLIDQDCLEINQIVKPNLVINFENSQTEIYQNFAIYFSLIDYCKFGSSKEVISPNNTEKPSHFKNFSQEMLKEISNKIINSTIDTSDTITGTFQFNILPNFCLSFIYLIQIESGEHSDPIIKVKNTNTESILNSKAEKIENLINYFQDVMKAIIKE